MVGQAEKRTVGAVLQARTSSTRLPGKVLFSLPYGSKLTVCEHIIRRLKKAESIDKIIMATTLNPDDDGIVSIAEKARITCYRGIENDVLSRIYEAARLYNLDEIVRITSDNPCLDYDLVDTTVRAHLDESSDYTITQNYPTGLNVEVVSFKALTSAHKNAKQPGQREHVTPYIREHDDIFRISVKEAPKIHRNPNIRVTLDTPEDYALLNCVFGFLYEEDNYFGVEELVSLYKERPWLADINRKVLQKKSRPADTLEDELEEAIHMLELQELNKARELLVSHLK